MFENVKNKVAFITGAASGIGLGIATKFAQYGAKVVIADLNLDNAQKVATELKNQYKVDTLAVAVDVSSEEQVNAAVAAAVTAFGGVDCLINNAGIQIISPINEFEFSQWKKVIDIHLHGTFLGTKAVMNDMIRRGVGGNIVTIGSVHSFEASKNKAAYVAAKHAQLGLMRALSKEGAQYGICANLVGPGFVKTPLVEKQIPEQAKTLGISEEEVVKKIMLGETVDGEFTTTDDIANVVIFLCAMSTNALTGQSIIASHGWHMQ